MPRAPCCSGNVAQADGRRRHEIRLAIAIDEEDAHQASEEHHLFPSPAGGETDTDYESFGDKICFFEVGAYGIRPGVSIEKIPSLQLG